MTNPNQIGIAVPEARAEAPASFVMKPPPSTSTKGKIEAFALGFAAGIAAVAIAAAIADNVDSEPSRSKNDGQGIDSLKDIIDITDTPQ